MDRIAALNEVLTENPKDAFARYGLAMEYSKQGDFDRALARESKTPRRCCRMASRRRGAPAICMRNRKWKPCWRSWVSQL